MSAQKWEERMREIDEYSRAIPYLADWRFNWTDGKPNLETNIPGTVFVLVLQNDTKRGASETVESLFESIRTTTWTTGISRKNPR